MSPKHPKLMSNRNRTNMLQIKYLIHDVEVAEQSDVLELRRKVVIVIILFLLVRREQRLDCCE